MTEKNGGVWKMNDLGHKWLLIKKKIARLNNIVEVQLTIFTDNNHPGVELQCNWLFIN